MLGAGFVGRGDFEQKRLIKRSREKFHRYGYLIWLRAVEAATVWIARIRHTVVDLAGKSRRDHNGRKAAHRAEIRDWKALFPLEDARLKAGVVHIGDAARINEWRRNCRVDIHESVKIVVRHHFVENALQILDAQRVVGSVRSIKRSRPGTE